MATTTSITTTYAGEFAGKYIAAALLSAPTLDKGGITIVPNVKFKQVIKRVATDSIIANATCDFDATSTITLTEKILQPEEFQVNLQLCKKDFVSDYEAISMGYSAFEVMPKNFTDFLLAHAAEKVAAAMETSIWTGVNATAGQFAGIMTQLTTDAALPSGQEIAAVGGGVNDSNVVAELGKIVDAIPAALYGKEDLKIYVSQNIAKAYVRALGGFSVAATSNNGTDNKGTQWYNNGELSIDGIPLFIANGLAANTAIAAQTSNLFFGCGLLADANLVKILDMSDLDGSDNIRLILRASYAVNYHSVSDIVTYGITNSAN